MDSDQLPMIKQLLILGLNINPNPLGGVQNHIQIEGFGTVRIKRVHVHTV